MKKWMHCKNRLRDSWICFDQTLLGLGLGKLFPALESLVSVIPAGDGNTAKPFFTVCIIAYCTQNAHLWAGGAKRGRGRMQIQIASSEHKG